MSVFLVNRRKKISVNISYHGLLHGFRAGTVQNLLEKKRRIGRLCIALKVVSTTIIYKSIYTMIYDQLISALLTMMTS